MCLYTCVCIHFNTILRCFNISLSKPPPQENPYYATVTIDYCCIIHCTLRYVRRYIFNTTQSYVHFRMLYMIIPNDINNNIMDCNRFKNATSKTHLIINVRVAIYLHQWDRLRWWCYNLCSLRLFFQRSYSFYMYANTYNIDVHNAVGAEKKKNGLWTGFIFGRTTNRGGKILCCLSKPAYTAYLRIILHISIHL